MIKLKDEFPSMVYVAWNGEGDEPFMQTEDTAQAHATLEGNVRVGCYKLESVITVATRIDLTKDSL